MAIIPVILFVAGILVLIGLYFITKTRRKRDADKP